MFEREEIAYKSAGFEETVRNRSAGLSGCSNEQHLDRSHVDDIVLSEVVVISKPRSLERNITINQFENHPVYRLQGKEKRK